MSMGKDNLKINISNIKDGEHRYEFKVSPEEIDFEDGDTKFPDELGVEAKVYKSGNEITADIKLDGNFKFICDRCLEEYEQKFVKKFEIIYKTDFKGEQKINESDDIKFISPNTRFIDLKDDIRDYVMLSVPMKRVPVEVNGFCEYCNKNVEEILKLKKDEEINPVWEKLIKQKQNKE